MAESSYLDDLDVNVGDEVVCKCDILNQGFTIGVSYTVVKSFHLVNDLGNCVIPSARFYKGK